MDLVGHGAFRPTHLGIVAQNHHYLGNADAALQALDEAMERSASSGELVHQPDLLRLRAEIITAAYPDRMDEAARDLVAAVDIGLGPGIARPGTPRRQRPGPTAARPPAGLGRTDPDGARPLPTQLLEPRVRQGARPH